MAPKPEGQPYEYRHGGQYVAYEKNGKKLIVTQGLADRMRNNAHPVATYVSPDSAEMDGEAFDMLRQACGGGSPEFDKPRFERYLDAVIEFETKYSDNEERHQHRLPIEEEILKVLTEGGYFAR
jgi:hypothetical protein